MNISLPVLLTIIFVIMRLCDVIAWSWWWVFSPLWIWAILVIIYAILLGISKN